MPVPYDMLNRSVFQLSANQTIEKYSKLAE